VSTRAATLFTRRPLWAAYLVAGLALTGLYLAVPPFEGSGPLINLLGLSGPVAIAIGVAVYRPRARAAWLLFAAGQFLFFSGDVYTYSYPKLTGADVPFPSPGDGLYLLVYPVLMAGVFLLVRRRNPDGDRAGVIESSILTVGIALLSWVFLVAPNIHLSGLSTFATAVSVAYPLGDVLLLAGAVRLAVDMGKRAPAFYLLVGSIVCLLTTDSVYTKLLLDNTYTHQLWLDTGWIMYYLLWGAAALHPSMRTLEEPAADRRVRLTPARLGVLSVVCLIAPSIRFAQELHNPDALVVIVGSGVMFLLVVGRMALLVRQEEQTAAREQALRNASVELVGAADPAQVHAAAIAAVASLAGPDVEVRVVSVAGERATLEASSDPATEGWELPHAARGWLAGAAAACAPLNELPPAVRAGLGLPQVGAGIGLPLSVREEPRGVLIVQGESLRDASTAQALRSLSMQVSLALEGATLTLDVHRRRSEARFRSLVAHSKDLITVVDRAGTVVYQSPSVESLLGLTAEEVEGRPFAALLHESDRERLQTVLRADGGHSDGHLLECSLRHRDGRWLQFEVRHANLLDDADVAGIVLNGHDVSERKAFEEQLAHQAFHDPVTNLANRALFADRVKHALARAGRDAPPVGVMFIDLDDFKTINDSLGHAAGDSVLHEVARRLERTVRPTDTVARFGGDEFAVLLETADGSAGAADVAERILHELNGGLELDGQQLYPRASIGICMGDASSDVETLLRNADVAMYMAKRDRKGGYRLFEPAMHARVVERLELRGDLERAIELGQLEVHYQPVVELDRHTVYGVEALLRWTHPTKGAITPAQFIPIAEETGLIIPIGRWVLQEACHQASHLHAMGDPGLVMSVNLSVKQLQSETIIDDVLGALEASGLPAGNLVLEITESVMMADVDLAVSRLRGLKALGVRLAMDDFGTGYSSLSYLSRFPVDILKMDRSFLGSKSTDTGLAAAIVGLGASLGLDVVAEGIEAPEQITSLRDLGCELGQGFLFAKAMNRDALSDYLSEAPGLDEPDEPEAYAA
jgi:diguanylate cyclase (GGDEF)-like protein/PAS domain S-box-containing protein